MLEHASIGMFILIGSRMLKKTESHHHWPFQDYTANTFITVGNADRAGATQYLARTAFSVRFGAVTGTRITGVRRHSWDPCEIRLRNFFTFRGYTRIQFVFFFFLVSLRNTRNNTERRVMYFGNMLHRTRRVRARATIEFRPVSLRPRRPNFGKTRERVDNAYYVIRWLFFF